MRASRRTATSEIVPVAILRDGRPRGRPPQDEVRGLHSTRSIRIDPLPALRRRLLFRLRLSLLADILRVLEEVLGGGGFAGCHHQAFLALRNHVFAAGDTLGLVGAAGDIDCDRHLDFGMQGHWDAMKTDVLDRSIEGDLAARRRKSAGGEYRHDVARRYG